MPKCQKITNNCKISEITKCGEKMQKIVKNVNKCNKNAKKRDKNGKKMAKLKKKCHRFSGSKLPQKMVLAFFTQCLVPEIRIFGHCWLKSAFLGPNFSRTEILTAKPMAVGCVQHYSTHFVKKLGKSLEPFVRKVQKPAKNGKEWQK